MRSLFITAAAVIAAIALSGCPKKRPQPVPGPQSTREDATRTATTGRQGVTEISWFQGTLEEAFSRTACHEQRALFRY
jgi:hypothetical protein